MDVRAHLADKGADIILPGMTEVLVLVDVLRSRVSVPLIDSNLAYAEHAVGADPTIAMLATCKRLEANGPNAVVIPCNTAHAFVSSIQRQLDISIVNMLSEVIAFAREKMPEVSRLGPLATSGTITSRVCHSTAEAAGMTLLVPDASVQARVMESICGADGVKAGFNSATSLQPSRICATRARRPSSLDVPSSRSSSSTPKRGDCCRCWTRPRSLRTAACDLPAKSGSMSGTRAFLPDG